MTTLINDSSVLVNDATLTVNGETWAAITEVTHTQPTITSFTPTRGTTGTVVYITGTGFSLVVDVAFNGVNAPDFTVDEFIVPGWGDAEWGDDWGAGEAGTFITAVVPSSATTGRITVRTIEGTATSSTDFLIGLGVDAVTVGRPVTKWSPSLRPTRKWSVLR